MESRVREHWDGIQCKQECFTFTNSRAETEVRCAKIWMQKQEIAGSHVTNGLDRDEALLCLCRQ